jgi:hypothetical protein
MRFEVGSALRPPSDEIDASSWPPLTHRDKDISFVADTEKGNNDHAEAVVAPCTRPTFIMSPSYHQLKKVLGSCDNHRRYASHQHARAGVCHSRGVSGFQHGSASVSYNVSVRRCRMRDVVPGPCLWRYLVLARIDFRAHNC